MFNRRLIKSVNFSILIYLLNIDSSVLEFAVRMFHLQFVFHAYLVQFPSRRPACGNLREGFPLYTLKSHASLSLENSLQSAWMEVLVVIFSHWLKSRFFVVPVFRVAL
jgi:hypothetical protein